MANKLLIIGESGAGKSTSVKNVNPKDTFIINCANKNLPFKGWKSKYVAFDPKKKEGNMLSTTNFEVICNALQFIDKEMPHIKNVIIDDFQYVIIYEFMERAKEKGYDKFTEMAQHSFACLVAPDKLRNDLTVVFLAHSEDVSGVNGMKTKMKTVGKMLDEKLTIEGLFSMVLMSVCFKDNENNIAYKFVTRGNGTNTVKTPEGMFEETLIPNDINYVLGKIKEYEQ